MKTRPKFNNGGYLQTGLTVVAPLERIGLFGEKEFREIKDVIEGDAA